MSARLGLVAVAVVAGCASGGGRTTTVVDGGIALSLPPGWHATGFSETVSPGRLVAASYEVAQADVEGDCGGSAAVERLPRDGAYVVVIDDYGAEARDRLPVELKDAGLENYGCFGESRMFRVALDGRTLQVHVGLGDEADEARRVEALAVVNSIAAER